MGLKYITSMRRFNLKLYRNHTGTVVVKCVRGHPRVENERDVLHRFQNQTPYLRPLIDEIKELSDTPTIVLKYLDDHLLNSSTKKTLNQKELKYVSRRILSALAVLHENGYVHTGEIFTQSSIYASLNPMLQISNLTISSLTVPRAMCGS